MLKSVNQWCFPEGTPLHKLFEISRDAGFDAVELNINPAGGVGLTMDTTPSEADAVAKLARDNGIQLRSISTSLMGRNPLSSADPDVRTLGRNVVIKQLDLAERMGADTVLVVPGVVNPTSSYDVCYERSLSELQKLLPEAEKRGVKMGIENVWNKFLLSPLEMRTYIDTLNSPFAGVYFDVGNILLYGFPQQWIRILGSRIIKVHVKDFKTAVGNGSGFVPLLAGDVNWPEVVAALKETGYTDTLTAEIGLYSASPLQQVYDTARQLEAIIKGGPAA
ncbi:sugar phosphate isomerase/epimerase family protein [Paenibacillus allorhizosphaerae]|uniref:L-ribulose-5-phosphate 3-epimerase UlaE n=1 Tax=Paenibacillus allorhizosphaerae TaxID=2849866 RepID=A0ABM8VSQ6_9BACL|nr:sugar phosphate isomerase/epimerase family protein [Paenibacillus allorhizosphaerae]CAG7656873.1 L-ribulose-5-phosphate 3-epimerase UlaE [Paenibacillus allorhizosphaerae]